MRVIAGLYRRRVLQAPTWEGLRPTADRVKETLFNILAPRVERARVLDGFCGSGALGIEALSRGAAHVTFVDADARAVELARANLAHCGALEGSVVIRGDYAAALRRLPPDARFDIILLDPPYRGADVEGILADSAPRLAGGGTIVFEHARKAPTPDRSGDLVCVRRVAAGDSGLAFYAGAGAGEAPSGGVAQAGDD